MDFERAAALTAGSVRQGSYLGLERVGTLLAKLGDPQLKVPCVHIAGTNGKGSTAAMTASVLISAGYRTGLYISPALFEFNERISVNGLNITDDELEAYSARLRKACSEMEGEGLELPTEFEYVTALAFRYYADRSCDVVVLETGMGGRLDATNTLIEPVTAVITPIGMDHMKELGNTLSAIAGEKAGIIRRGCRVVSAVQQPEAAAVIEKKGREEGARLSVAEPEKIISVSRGLTGQTFDYGELRGLKLGLCGEYQLENAALVIKNIEAMREKGYRISENALRVGLEHAVWRGRMEPLRLDPPVIFDGSHNLHGVKALTRSLRGLFGENARFVFAMGVLADKNYDEMISELAPLASAVVTLTPPNPRALSAQALAERVKPLVPDVTASDDISGGLGLALEKQRETGLPLCCMGSLYSARAIYTYFGRI